MILLKLKNADELKKKAKGKSVLAVCGLCPGWNFSADEIENFAKGIGAQLAKTPPMCNMPDMDLKGETVFVLACGAGVQTMGQRLNKTVIPAADTVGIGVKVDGKIRRWCVACGDCMVDETGSICPKARCEKSLLNGPCAGVHGGLCELSTKETPITCGWNEICATMKGRGETGKFTATRMPKVKR